MITIQSKKKINIICTFVFLSFSLLFNVSYAGFGSTGRSSSKISAVSSDTDYSITSNYTMNDIQSIAKGYYAGTLAESIYNEMCSELESNGYAFTYDKGSYHAIIVYPYETVDIGYCESSKKTYVYGMSSELAYVYVKSGTSLTGSPGYQKSLTTSNTSGYAYYYDHFNTSPDLCSHSVKSLTMTSNKLYWDGESYFYKAPEKEENLTLPTNAEITQAVQAFYDSDYYKNNKDFKDFLVMYNAQTKYFNFIGHTLGNTLGQVIIPPNYRYQGRLYNEQWWKFFIEENQGALPYGASYYLYSSNDFGENIINEGIGKISELIDLDFSTKSVIVYSTTDYLVRTYVLDETSGDYMYTDGIIEGDQYTYNENLDPTVNGYNPLDNFVTVDPSQTIIGDADFEGFVNSFEEHKDLFSFTENMQWLIIANNKLSNYFLGFLVMCALFITLGRVLKG